MRTNKSEVTVVTLANGCELVASIAAEVLGTTLPDSLNGSPSQPPGDLFAGKPRVPIGTVQGNWRYR